MMGKNLFFLALILFCSCGRSPEEIALQQKQRDDSIRVVVMDSIQRVQNAKQRVEDSIKQLSLLKRVLTDSLSELKMSFNEVNSRLSIERATLAAEQDAMRNIQSFKFMRTPAERKEEIKRQTIVIDGLEKLVRSLESRRDELQSQINSIKAKLLPLGGIETTSMADRITPDTIMVR